MEQLKIYPKASMAFMYMKTVTYQMVVWQRGLIIIHLIKRMVRQKTKSGMLAIWEISKLTLDIF